MTITAINTCAGLDKREDVPIENIRIPDLWHIASRLREQGDTIAADQIFYTWHIAHDMLNTILSNQKE